MKLSTIPVTLSDTDKLHFMEMFEAYYREQKFKSAIDPLDPAEFSSIFWRKAVSICIVNKVGVVLFAKADGKIAGMLYWLPTPTFTKTRKETLTGGVYVKKEYRRQGICTMLHSTAASIALEQGFTHYTGSVNKGNSLGEWVSKDMLTTGYNVQCKLEELK